VPREGRDVTTPSPSRWPKKPRELTPDELRIRDDWMKQWLDEHMTKNPSLRLVDHFNQSYALRSARRGAKTLEIGAGVGAHCHWEDLSAQEYYCCELREELAAKTRERFPRARTTVGDCQERLDFPDGYFDRVLAIHVLEHLPNLPKALAEIHRVLSPSGAFSVVIPCEGGFGYDIARRISSKRLFEKRYDWDYYDYIATEHVSTAREVIEELEGRFRVDHRRFFPALVPAVDLNLVIGLTLTPKP
jgi:SAM-dependent methyltransferase